MTCLACPHNWTTPSPGASTPDLCRAPTLHETFLLAMLDHAKKSYFVFALIVLFILGLCGVYASYGCRVEIWLAWQRCRGNHLELVPTGEAKLSRKESKKLMKKESVTLVSGTVIAKIPRW